MINKTSLLFLCSLFCILLSGYTHWLYTMYLETVTEEQVPHKNELSLMTWNVRRMGKEDKTVRLWKNRKELVINVLRDHMPDIIGFQEPIAEQLNNLAIALPEYAWVGSGRGDSWFGISESEFTPIFYKKDRLILHEEGTFFINDGAAMPWQWSKDGMLPRITTWACFESIETQQQFYVYNTHLDNNYSEARVKGLKATLKHIKNRAEKDLPIFLMGDFNQDILHQNDEKFHDELEKKLNNNQFVHTKTIAANCVIRDATQSNWGMKQTLVNIDHILLRDPHNVLTIMSYQVIPEKIEGQYPSDHRPVLVHFQLPFAKSIAKAALDNE